VFLVRTNDLQLLLIINSFEFMYAININPEDVHKTLSKHILADGYDITFDLDRSHGATIYDAKSDTEILDLFTCFASVPLGYNHPKMLGDALFKDRLLRAALNNLSNSDVYTVEFAQFVDT